MSNRDEFKNAFKKIRPQVLARDFNCCVKCGADLSPEVHHIDGYRNNDPDNLVTLCYLCHGVAPMGKELFDQWLLFGESGIDVLISELRKTSLPIMTRYQTVEFCRVLLKFNCDTSKGKLKAARDRLRGCATYCEGRKPYGTRPGELEIVRKMAALRDGGNVYREIANELNTSGILTRYGKYWKGSTVQKILLRIAHKSIDTEQYNMTASGSNSGGI